MQSGIVLNRMYVGDYLASNLGHEVINLYQADNGCHYIYLNSTGDFVKVHQGKVGYMLFVKYYGKGEVEVIGKAEGLKDVYKTENKPANAYEHNPELLQSQIDFINAEGGITYGGASILDIFAGSGQQNVFITYKAGKVYVPKEGKRLFIRFHSDKPSDGECSHEEEDVVIELEGYQQAKASLKQYIYSEGTYKGDLTKKNITQKKEDYVRIFEGMIARADLWEESNNKVDDELVHGNDMMRPVSLFDICMIQNDENKFSNALSYFMLQPQYRGMWRRFFKKYDIDLGEEYTVTREEASKITDNAPEFKRLASGGRIDLLIRDNNKFVVIENKIKSDINSVEEDGEGLQLERYWNYITWLSQTKDPHRTGKHAFVLTPDYNIPEIPQTMKNKYKIMTYSKLYGFLIENKCVFEDDVNFCAFLDAMFRHTHNNVNDYLYYEMQEKFVRRINDIITNH
ncbi:MAG: PD-(D/E)XK nuclease family protein [Bacteroidales bacterium]|nr:PD-(D/E)XK nuclease family protein [Bacteroidales bacterium]